MSLCQRLALASKLKDAGRKRPANASQGLPFRALVPNAITALALCSGLTAIRYAMDAKWEYAAFAVLLAALFDVLDGRVARMINGTSRFGAELDSLSDVVAFGVAPSLILYLWSLHDLPRFGWLAALAFTVCSALRLARFNAQLDAEELPYKKAGFLTGVPTPAGAGIALIPLFCWLAVRDWPDHGLIQPWLHNPNLAAALLLFSAFLMIVQLPSWSWLALRIARKHLVVALLCVALVFGALLVEPWETLSVVTIIYLLSIPFAWLRYTQLRRLTEDAAA